MIWRVVHISSGERGAEKIGCRIAERSPGKVHKKRVQNCSAIWNGKDVFEAKEWDKWFKVDVERRTCSCKILSLHGANGGNATVLKRSPQS